MNKDRENYTIVYYDTLKKMNYNITEYVVFDTLIRFSKKNEFKKPKAFLHQYLHLASNTIETSIDILSKKGYIEETKKIIYLNYEIVELFSENNANSKFIKIYHKHRFELNKMSLHRYALLYAFYSLSLRYGHTSAKVKFYQENLGIKERNYHRIKEDFLKNGFIQPHQNNYVKVSPIIKNWFDKQDIQK